MSDPLNPPIIERRVTMLEGSQVYLRQSMDTVVDKLERILEQNTKVAILAEKTAAHQIDLERAALRIEKVECNHAALSKQVSEFISFITGVTKLAYLLWTGLGGVTFLVLIKVLFYAGSVGFVP